MSRGGQLEMRLAGDRERCPHRSSFVTMAYVPAGVFCDGCGTLLCQVIPQGPEVLGYVSADWAWRHVDGKAWTTQEGGG